MIVLSSMWLVRPSLIHPHSFPLTRNEVYGVFILDFVQTILATYHGWLFCVQNWNVTEFLFTIPWVSAFIPIWSGLSELIHRRIADILT